MKLLLPWLLLCVFTSTSMAHLLEGIYCGKENCYDVLGVTRDSSKSEIAKNYRKLARQYHPDVHRTKDAKLEAQEHFKVIANAYEILKDEDSRMEYDDMLDNPDQMYAHYYRYYRRRLSPKVDVRIVLIVTISIISLIQYYNGWQKYDTAIKYFMTVPKYRNRAIDIATQEGLLPNDKKPGSSSRKHKMNKEELESVIEKVIKDKMDIKGAYAKPTIWDILWLQLLWFPVTLVNYIYWYVSWLWRHNVLKQDYNDEEKLYIIRRKLKMGRQQFDNLEEDTKEDYLERELWIGDKFDVWFAQVEEDAKIQLAANNRHKQYRRYIKKHGVGRMTFDDS